jgi:hypothetical protein
LSEASSEEEEVGVGVEVEDLKEEDGNELATEDEDGDEDSWLDPVVEVWGSEVVSEDGGVESCVVKVEAVADSAPDMEVPPVAEEESIVCGGGIEVM